MGLKENSNQTTCQTNQTTCPFRLPLQLDTLFGSPVQFLVCISSHRRRFSYLQLPPFGRRLWLSFQPTCMRVLLPFPFTVFAILPLVLMALNCIDAQWRGRLLARDGKDGQKILFLFFLPLKFYAFTGHLEEIEW